jgi:MinD superfamily P-loop ATPase
LPGYIRREPHWLKACPNGRKILRKFLEKYGRSPVKEIVVLSGKGGTGKTSIVASLAVLAENKVLADCDVDAADLDILLDPSIQEKHDFAGGKVAFIDSEKCARCNICAQVCRFDAITDLKVDPLNCEGCGFCSHVCPVDAITMQPSFSGNWFISSTKYGPLVHAVWASVRKIPENWWLK